MKNLNISGLVYKAHPGGKQHLELAKNHPCSHLLYLSYHLGCNHNRIESVAHAHDIKIPQDIRSEFYNQINNEAIKIRNEHHVDIMIYHIYCLIVTIAIPPAIVYYLMSLSVISAILLGFLFVTYAFNIFHLRHHFGGRLYTSGTHKKSRIMVFLDQITSPLYEFLDNTFMITPKAWRHQHQTSHHIFTNNIKEDFDVRKPYPVLRLHPHQQWKWYHRWQHYYAPIVLALNGLTFAADNFFLKGGKGIYFLTHYFIMLIIPLYFHGLTTSFITYILLFSSASLLSSYLFQVSHNSLTSMNCPFTDNPYQLNYEQWHQLQVEESISYGGYITTLLFGGINLQTEHHVAPAMEPPLLFYFRPFLQRTSSAKGFSYRFMPNFARAVIEYHKRLSVLAKK